MITLGLETQRQEHAFERMTAALGVNGQRLADELVRTSRGMANAADIMVTAASGLQEALRPEQLVKLMEVATAQSVVMGTTVTEAFNQITAAILSQQERGLKTARIYIDSATALETYAARLGTTADKLTDAAKVQAFFEATVEKATPTLAALGNQVLTNAQQVERLTTAWQEAKEKLAVFLVDMGAGIARWASSVHDAVMRAGPAIDAFAAKWYPGAALAQAAAQDRHNESLREAARAANAAAAGASAFGTNSAASAAQIRVTAAETKKLADEIERLLDAGMKGWVAYADAVQTALEEEQKAEAAIVDRARAMEDALLAQNTAGWVAYADAVLAATEAEQKAEAAIVDRARAMEDALLAQNTAGWVAYADAVQTALEEEQKAEAAIVDRARKSADAFAILAAKTRLLGDDFDASGARISLLRNRLDELLQTTGGQLTPEIEALGAAIRRELADQSLYSSIERGFLSITDTFTKMADGLIAGTLDIGDAFTNLGRSLVTNFVQIVLHEVFDPILREAARFVSGLVNLILSGGSSSAGGGIGLGQFGGGLGTGLGQFSGQLGGLTSGGYLSSAGLGLGVAAYGQSQGGGWGNALSAVGYANTAYNAVAYLAGWPSTITLVMDGLTALATALGLVTTSTSGLIAGMTASELALVGWGAAAAGAGAGAAAAGAGAGAAAGAGGAGILGPGGGGVSSLAGPALVLAIPLIAGLIATWDVAEIAWRNLHRYRSEFGFTQDVELRRQQFATGQRPLDETVRQDLSVLRAHAEVLTGRLREGLQLLSEGVSVDELALRGIYFGDTEPTPEAYKARIEKQLAIYDEFFAKTEAMGIETYRGLIDLGQGLRDPFGAIHGAENTIERWNAALSGLRDPLLSAEELATKMAEAFNDLAKAMGLAEYAVPQFKGATPEETRQLLLQRREQLFEDLLAEPAKIVALLDLEKLKREGESTEDVIKRLATALGGLGVMAQRLDDEVQALTGADVAEQAVKLLERAFLDIQKLLDQARVDFAAATGPEEMLDAALRAEQAIRAQYAAIAQTVMGLTQRLAALNGALLGTAQSIVAAGATLDALGISFDGFTGAMAGFVAALPSVVDRLLAYPALMAAAFLEVQQTFMRTQSPSEALGRLAPIGQVFSDVFAAVQQIKDPAGRLAALNTYLGQLDALYQGTVANIRSMYDQLRTQAQGMYDQLVAQAQAEYQRRVEVARAEHQRRVDAIREAAALEIEGLEARRTALQQQIQDARRWKSIAEGLAATLTTLRAGDLAPPDARAQYEAARAAFKAASPEQKGAAAQVLLQTALNTGLMTLPSPEYQALFKEITAELELLRADAEQRGAPEEAAVAELERLNAQIAQVRADADAQVKALDAALAAYLDDLGGKLKTYLDDLGSRLKTYFDDLAAEETAAIKAVQDALAPYARQTLDAIVSAARDVALLAETTQAQLDLITGKTPVELYMALKQTEMAEDLANLRDDIREALRDYAAAPLHELLKFLGLEIPTAQAGLTTTGAGGLVWTHPGEAVLSQGAAHAARSGGLVTLAPDELVIPRSPAEMIRAWAGSAGPSGGAGGVTLAITVNVTGGGDAAVIRREAEAGVRAAVKHLAQEGVLAAWESRDRT